MHTSFLKKINDAIARAIASPNWNPVYADVYKRNSGDWLKVGHITSDGFAHATWTFYPITTLRKASRRDYVGRSEQQGKRGFHRVIFNRSIDNIVPKWVGAYALLHVETYDEKNQKFKAKVESVDLPELNEFFS